MATNENKMWLVETQEGVACIGRDPEKDPKASAKAQKGHFWFYASKSLGYPVIFKDKATAQKFATSARRTKLRRVKRRVLEVEFYKGEMEG